MAHSPFDHVKDHPYFETSPTIGLGWWAEVHGHQAFGIHLPTILGIQITKFMVLQLIAASAVMLIMWGLSSRVKSGEPVRGRFWNFWEALVMFIRNEVVRPTIGHDHHDHHDHSHDPDGPWAGTDPEHSGGAYLATHSEAAQDAGEAAMDRLASHGAGPLDDVMAAPYAEGGAHPADKYLPFVATLFFYILICNLLGMVPWMGSPTGSISVTGALAVITLIAVFMFGIQALGLQRFTLNFCPSGVPSFLVPLIWVIEAGGLLIKHFVLAVRLFANMMAGHVVLAVFLLFIYDFAVHPDTHELLSFGEVPTLYWVILPASILGQVAISLLELFVAFLQSYIFAFLATLFIATVVHEH